MKCPKCGSELNENDKFCQFCGAKIDEDTMSDASTSETAQALDNPFDVHTNEQDIVSKNNITNNENIGNNGNNTTNNMPYPNSYANPNSNPNQAASESENCGIAICSLIFGLLGGWLGLVFGIVGLKKYKNTGNKAMCIIGIVFWAIWQVVLISSFANK